MSSVTNNTNTPTTTSQTKNASTMLNGTLNDFLKLLTTQLKNQDPTEPADTNQMTQQIASLSQVEQQINTNSNLEKLIAMYGGNQVSSSCPTSASRSMRVGTRACLQVAVRFLCMTCQAKRLR